MKSSSNVATLIERYFTDRQQHTETLLIYDCGTSHLLRCGTQNKSSSITPVGVPSNFPGSTELCHTTGTSWCLPSLRRANLESNEGGPYT
jgi:hypothetical protein